MQRIVPEDHLLLQKFQKRFEEHCNTVYVPLVKSNTLQVTVSFTKEIMLTYGKDLVLNWTGWTTSIGEAW